MARIYNLSGKLNDDDRQTLAALLYSVKSLHLHRARIQLRSYLQTVQERAQQLHGR